MNPQDFIHSESMSVCCDAPMLEGGFCSECREHAEEQPRCPECDSPCVNERHINPTFALPEGDCLECEDCGHQWDHS